MENRDDDNSRMAIIERKIDRLLRAQAATGRKVDGLGRLLEHYRDIETITASEAAELCGMKPEAFNNGIGMHLGRVLCGRKYMYNKAELMDALAGRLRVPGIGGAQGAGPTA